MTQYAEDYAKWIEETALAVEEGRFSEVDRAALADEVRDLGKSERREIESALRVLVTHMLKAKYQPEQKTRSWEIPIGVQRKHVAKFLRQSASLRPELPELLEFAYDNARIDAANETGLEIDVFPEICEWPLSEVLS